MNKPIIAIVADHHQYNEHYWHASPTTYIDAAVEVAGVIPIILPAVGEKLDMENIINKIDGLMITGARSNVHPKNYGQKETKDHEPFDTKRDETTLPFIKYAIQNALPVLAICRGIQELNVALGGTLTAAFQKTRGINHPTYKADETLDQKYKISHEVEIEKGCNLEKILKENFGGESFGGENCVRVKSLHSQAIDKLGENVIVEARAKDGTIEAIGVKNAPGFVVGVQWHPEYWAKVDEPSHAILSAFGDAVRQYATKKSN